MSPAPGTLPGPGGQHAGRPEEGRHQHPRPALPDLPGVSPWTHCFTEQRREAVPATPDDTLGPWRVASAPRQPFGRAAQRVFASDPAAGTVLALVGDPVDPQSCATLAGAAREAIGTGRLVVITPSTGLTGYCASLHAEHPALGVTLIQAPPTPEGVAAARRFAAAAPGEFREVQIGQSGTAKEPVMVVSDPAADGTFPLGPADVVLVTGVTRPGDLECATALASRGAALAVIAPPGPEHPRLAAHLAKLRVAGVRVGRKKADLSDPGQISAAVRSLERGFGPVTAVVHAVAPGPIERIARLADASLRSYLASQRSRFSNVLSAVAMERLRVIVTFGSASARYGLVSGACEALASGLLAEQVSRLADTQPRCRALHVDWGPWAGDPRGGVPGARTPGGEDPVSLPPGITPISVEDGARLLLDLLTTLKLPPRVTVHGRYGVPAPARLLAGLTAAPPRGRFLTMTRVHYPGVEVVAESRLSLPDDPYLTDYRLGGIPVLPPSMALEAMAQAAAMLTGRPRRHASEISLDAPVVVPASPSGGQTIFRVCALRAGDTVETVLRCSETGFRVNHARAVFSDSPAVPLPPVTAASPSGPPGGGPLAAALAPAGGAAAGAVVDGTDLYGPVYFQTGRFRRVAFLPEVTSRSCRALVRGGDDVPWFGAIRGPVDSPLMLGSPGLNDATLHLLQACLPHRRVLPASCESVTFTGREVRGALRVNASRRPAPDQASGWAWDVTAEDATGQLVVAWHALRLRDVGPLARAAPWHPALLAASLESRAAELGLGGSLRAEISWGLLPGGGAAIAARPPATPDDPPPVDRDPDGGDPDGGDADGGDADGRDPVRGDLVRGDPVDGGTPEGPREAGGPDTGPAARWADRARGRGPLDGFTFSVRAESPVACRWQAVVPQAGQIPADNGLTGLRRSLGARREPGAAADARTQVIASCLAGLGRPADSPVSLVGEWDDGWILVRAAGAVVACTVTEISGVPVPVALAIATRPGSRVHPDGLSRGQGRDHPVTANGSGTPH